MDSVALDTSVVIDYLNNQSDAVRFVEPLLVAIVGRVHPVVLGEVLVGAKSQSELRSLELAISTVPMLTVKSSDFLAALDLIRRYTLSHGIGWPHCLIAATCLRLKLPLVTLNDRHFRPIRGSRSFALTERNPFLRSIGDIGARIGGMVPRFGSVACDSGASAWPLATPPSPR